MGGKFRRELEALERRARNRAIVGSGVGAGMGAGMGGLAGHELAKQGAAIASRLTPQSSNVRGYSYDRKTQDLVVTFKGGGTYRYAKVPPAIARAMGSNKSVGKTLNRRVKAGGFKYEKTANDPVKEVVKIHDIPIALEWRRGETRKYFNHDPLKRRSTGSIDYDQKMKADYGYVKGVIDADGEELDVYLGPNRESEKVFVLEKMRRTDNSFDENKVMLGYDSLAEAKKSYLQHQGKDEMGKVMEMTAPAFKAKFLRKNKFKKHGADAIRFPGGEHSSLKERLDKGKAIYTTRVSKELGKYSKGQELDSNLGTRLKVGAVRRLSGIEQHPFMSELSPQQVQVLRKYDQMDLVKLTKTANGDMMEYFQKHPKKWKERQERLAAKKKRNRDGFKYDQKLSASERFVLSRSPGGLSKKATVEESINERLVAKRRAIAKLAGAAKKQVTWGGLTMKLEYLVGDTRSGVNRASGQTWSRVMKDNYGYVPGTYGKGADGEALDIYLAPEPVDGPVYKIRQQKKDGGYDEDKFLIAYSSADAARKAFGRNMPDWAFGSMTRLSMKKFKEMVGQ